MFREIPFIPVKSAGKNQALRFVFKGETQPAMKMWLMEGESCGVGDYQSTMAQVCAAQIRDWLQAGLTTNLINTGITRHYGTKCLTFTHFLQNHRRQRQSSRTRLAALAGVFNHHPTESAVTIDVSFRTLSPVSGVVVAVAGMAKISPFEVVKRTSVPVLVGLVIVIVATELMVPGTAAAVTGK